MPDLKISILASAREYILQHGGCIVLIETRNAGVG